MSKKWLFKILNPPETVAERQFTLEGGLVSVGRIPEADLSLPWDKKVSRLHAKLELSGNFIQISDLNSTNGTYHMENFVWQRITGVRNFPSPVEIRFGDTIVYISYGTHIQSDSELFSQSSEWDSSSILKERKLIEAILVLDLCGSSSLANQAGDGLAYHLKKRMFQICDVVFNENASVYIKNTGDGFFATFGNPGVCLESAVMILKKLAARNRVTKSKPIDVRIGLHYGDMYIVDEVTNDRHGNDLNIAFRVEGVTASAFEGKPLVDLPEKNRILATQVFYEMCNPQDAPFKRLGKAQLKGIQDPMELFLYSGKI